MKRMLPLVVMLCVAGCGSRPAPELYVLRVPEGTGLPACGKQGGALLVDRPSSRQEYDSKRIAVLLDTNHLTYYTGANFASPLPDQLRDFMIDAFTQSGRFTTVAAEADDTREGYRLQMTVLEAEIVDQANPVVMLRLSGTLRSNATGKALAQFRVQESVPAVQNHMPEIIEAYDRAAANAAQKIAQSLCRR